MSDTNHSSQQKRLKKRVFKKIDNDEWSIEDLAQSIINGDRKALASGITLVESRANKHRKRAAQLIQLLLPNTGKSIRIGITGVPGAGKSTWIEAFGKNLVQEKHKIAVLAIDPSSSLSGGSILGDKTRMEELSHHQNVFIRPTPTAGTLGGVHRMTRETMLLCEAASYDIILVETVGVGQSEVMVRGMVDFFLLLALTGGGDELQGMKKGIMELVDAIVINKADGDNKVRATKARNEYRQLLHYLQPATKGWQTTAITCSATKGEGIVEIWELIERFIEEISESGVMEDRRKSQSLDWMKQMIHDRLFDEFMNRDGRKEELRRLKEGVIVGEVSPTEAVETLFTS